MVAKLKLKGIDERVPPRVEPVKWAEFLQSSQTVLKVDFGV